MRTSLSRIVLAGLLVIAAIVALFPIAWMTMTSVKPEDEIYKDPPIWVSKHPTLRHYRDLFNRFNFGRLTWNSLVITAGVLVISTVFGTMAAYGFSRYDFRGSGALLGALLAARMITPSALVVPLYAMMRALGQLNTLTGIVIGITVLNLPFVVWMMKPFMDELPRQVEEAAELDGLSPMRVFWQIVVPLAAPGLFTVALFSVVTGWVDVLFGMSFSTTTEAMPLTAGLLQMQTGYQIYWGPMMAGGVYLTLPTAVLSFGLQKYLVRGMRAGF